MGVPVIPLRRLAITVAGALVVLGFVAASAPSQSNEGDAVIQLVTAGPGTLTIFPTQDGPKAVCKIDGQQPVPGSDGGCVQYYEPGTRVTLDAVPDKGHSFRGWSDFACANRSRRCRLTLFEGTRYVTARFSPVTVRIMVNENPPDPDPDPSVRADQNLTPHPFGLISVTPKPNKPCSLNDGDRCEYPLGTKVTLSGEYVDPDYFWIGACEGNEAGKLESKHDCTLYLLGDEVVGAGWKHATDIPPRRDAGITVAVGGSGRGKVTGDVITEPDAEALDCPPQCSIAPLGRYDHVSLTAAASKGSHFSRWSDSSKLNPHVVRLSGFTRIRAFFAKN